jgi:hypothetical protein
MKTTFLTLTLFFTLLTAGFSQSEKLKTKIEEKIEEINTDILAGDSTQALSDEQRAKIFEIEFSRVKAVRKAKKDNATDEDLKEIHKSHGKQIYSDVLTKDQKKARRKGKDKK